MPRLSALMIRLSLVSLLLGSTVGALLLGQYPPAVSRMPQLRGLHRDLMLFGWLVQFVLGVAYWILPRHASRPERGPRALAATGVALFQGGLVLALLGSTAPALYAFAPAGRLLLAGASLLFAFLLLPRIKPFGSP
jgi:heme/copper-type cytochrome/quinol oxidase subunit 1